MAKYGLWHEEDKKWLTLADLQVPCPRAVAIYATKEDAQFDIEHRVAKKDKKLVSIHIWDLI